MKVTDELVERAIAAQMKRVAQNNCTPFDSMYAAIESALGDLPEVRVPDGWKLVPVEPDEKMALEGASQSPNWKPVWMRMISAAPTPLRGE